MSEYLGSLFYPYEFKRRGDGLIQGSFHVYTILYLGTLIPVRLHVTVGWIQFVFVSPLPGRRHAIPFYDVGFTCQNRVLIYDLCFGKF
jgi:hypothetical protein